MAELYIGLMSGTSMDGIDAVIVDLSKRPRLVASQYNAYDETTRQQLLTLVQQSKANLASYALLDAKLGHLYAHNVNDLLASTTISKESIHAIGSHGQTIYHDPASEQPSSLQIGDPNVIAALTGITTIADFRRADMAVGGQGAPLVPAFHDSALRNPDKNLVIANIGGIANITILPSNPDTAIAGFDTGPGNLLMDGWIKQHLRLNYDDNGQWAASGHVDVALLERMLAAPYFQQAPPKSTGREYFNLDWLNQILKRHRKRVFKKNVQATLCELTALSIKQAIDQHAPDTEEVFVCGGGVHNLALMFRLQALLSDINVSSSEDIDIDPDYMEAMAFAWLAKQTLAGKPGNLPSVTGASRAVVLGGIYKP